MQSLELLEADALEALSRAGGTAIIYTHWTSQPKEVFTLKALEGLRLLRKYYEQGTIWVAPTSQLLDFTLARSYLNYTTETNKDKLIIRIHGIDNPVGSTIPPSKTALRGISFECPSDRAVAVFLGETEMARDALNWFDVNGRTVVQIPLGEGVLR